ncbi:MAG: alpha/beta hydrolase-fold protein [Actinomycetota bacterium]
MHPLLDDVARTHGDLTTVTALRRALQQHRGPLVSPLDDGTVTVTFVWFADTAPDAAGSTVSLQCGLADHSGRAVAMTHLDATPVWIHEVVCTPDAIVSYRFVVDDPFAGAANLGDREFQQLMLAAQARSFADPFNPRRIAPLAVLFGLPVPDTQFESVLQLADAPEAAWFEPHDAPAGRLESFDLTSTALGNTRTITVHTPAGRSAPHPLPVAILLDGSSFLQIAQLPRALDMAVHHGHLAPCHVAFVSEPHGGGGFANRTVELSCNPRHAQMLVHELLPQLRHRFDIASSPDDVVLGGASLGGLASTYTALEHAPAIGNVLSISGSYWFGAERDGQPEWLTRRFAEGPTHTFRIHQQIGNLEDSPLALSPGVSHLVANRHFRDVAVAKGHRVQYIEDTTAHDVVAFRLAAMRGLIDLLPGATP